MMLILLALAVIYSAMTNTSLSMPFSVRKKLLVRLSSDETDVLIKFNNALNVNYIIQSKIDIHIS